MGPGDRPGDVAQAEAGPGGGGGAAAGEQCAGVRRQQWTVQWYTEHSDLSKIFSIPVTHLLSNTFFYRVTTLNIEFRVLKLYGVKILGCVYFGDWNYLSVKATIFVNSGKSFMCISCTSTFNKCKQYILILISCSCVPLALCITMGM